MNKLKVKVNPYLLMINEMELSEVHCKSQTIFEIHYFFFEPFKWYKKFISNDIIEILLAPDTGLNLKGILDENDKVRWDQVDEYFKERRQLGYDGKIYIKPIERDELALNNLELKIKNLASNNSIIKISDVTALIAGILPYDLRINLLYLNFKYGEPNESVNKVKIIRDLVFFLRESGLRRVNEYQINFHDSRECFLKYENESCILYHFKKKILNDFVGAINKIMNI